MLRVLVLTILIAAAVPSGGLTDPSSAWRDPGITTPLHDYLCRTNAPQLTTPEQAGAWFVFANSREAIYFKDRNRRACQGGMMRLLNIIWDGDPIVAPTLITALAQRLEMSPRAADRRVARDTELLGWLIMACKSWPGEEQTCITRAVSDVDPRILAASPVFCDLSSAQISPAALRKFRDYQGNRALPTCSRVFSGKLSAARDPTAWWSRVGIVMLPDLKH